MGVHAGRPPVPVESLPHGTARWARGCRCFTCRVARARAGTELKRWRSSRDKDFALQAAARVSAVMDELGEIGTHASVAKAMGVSTATVHQLLSLGPSQYRRSTIEAAMNLTAEDVLQHSHFLPAKISVQRLRSLYALGWSFRALAELGGIDKKSVLRLAHGHQSIVRRDLHKKVAALANRLGDREGPSRRAREEAQRNHWYPPGCYDSRGNYIPGSARHQRRKAS